MGNSLYYGPFVSRVAAEKFMNDSLDFFKMRRCVEDLHPDPAFPRLHLFGDEDVPGALLQRLQRRGVCERSEPGAGLFRFRGRSLARETLSRAKLRQNRLAFEDAAAIHARAEKLKPILGQLPEIVQRLDHSSR
jgi:excinuclease ABC subunit C